MVVVILAIIIGVAISGIYGYVKKSRINTDLNNASAMQKALSTLQTDKEVNNILKDLPIGSSAEITWSDEQKIDTNGIKASQTGKKDATVDSKFNSQFISKIGELLSNGLPSSKTGEQFKITFERTSAEEIICHVSSGVASESSGGSESGTGGSTGGSESGTGGSTGGSESESGGSSSETHEHSYTSEITKEATCTEDGVRTYTCSNCGDSYTDSIPAAGGHIDENGDGLCDRDLEEVYVAGETYTLGGYEWVAAEVNEGYVTLQSTGVTAGEWPGRTMAKFGNGSYYTSNIDGQDISAYDAKTTALYNSIKSAEYSGASYGEGLFLVSKAKAGTTTGTGSSNYLTALKAAAANYESFGAVNHYAWLGTVYSSDFAWYVLQDGYIIIFDGSQGNSYVVAPAFNLNPSKVTLEGNALTIK